MRNQPSGWFFYACEILGLLRSPSRHKAAPTGRTRSLVGAALCRDGPQSGPKILNKKNFSDDWQVFKPACKEIYTRVAEFSLDFRFTAAV